jgi:alpha-galactosidase
MPITHLDELDLRHAIQGWQTPKARRSVTGGPLAVAGRTWERGIGTHSVGWLGIRCHGRAERCTVLVGVDDAVGIHGQGAVRFQLRGDGRVLADSGDRRGGEPAVALAADLRGIGLLELLTLAPGDTTHHGHGNWCDGVITWEGSAPEAVARPRGEPVIRTPAPGPEPRFVAGWRIGSRPGAPVRWTIPCLGEDLTFAAEGLPPGLHLDPGGILVGTAPGAGVHAIRLTARNRHGVATRTTELVIGAGAPLPPMGWSSWNCCHAAIDGARIRANAEALVAQGLHRYGYQRVNIDDGWQGARPVPGGPLQPGPGFPDMAGLVAGVHRLGLLAGIYHVPTVHSPQGLAGGSADHPDGRVDTPFRHGGPSRTGPVVLWDRDVAQFAAWGFDYLKLDEGPTPEQAASFAAAIRATGRTMLLSLSAGRPRDIIEQYRGHAQLWRTTSDLIDTWFSVKAKFRSQTAWQGVGRPDGWNDPDMLVVGAVGPGWDAPLQPSRLAYEEQYLHVGLWAFLAAPLMIGGDLTLLDPFTRALLTNPAIIELDQDPLADPARLVAEDADAGTQVWRRRLHDGATAVALVNLGDDPATLALPADLTGPATDLWTGAAVDTAAPATLPPRSHRLVRIAPG